MYKKSRLKNIVLAKKRDYTDAAFELGRYLEDSIQGLELKYFKLQESKEALESIVEKNNIDKKYDKFKSMLVKIKNKCDSYSFKK
jgi:sulfopyruvate decarboxylase TPP-binding subunit